MASASATLTRPRPTDPFKYVWTFTETGEGGYKFSGQFQVGDPEKYKPGVTSLGSYPGAVLHAGAVCSISPVTDAVIPAQVTVTNNTSGFPASTGVTIAWGPQWSGTAEVGYSSGPVCFDQYKGGEYGLGSSSFSVVSTQQLGQGASVATYMFFVIRNYFTPDHPEGDTSLLATPSVALMGANANVVVDSVVGPGVEKLTVGVSVYYLPLAPGYLPSP